MALSGFGIFRSECTGIGFWTHFFLGAIVAVALLTGFPRLHFVLWLCLLTYQISDYCYGEESQFTAEGALARDVGEYAVGYCLVLLGASLERQNASTKGE